MAGVSFKRGIEDPKKTAKNSQGQSIEGIDTQVPYHRIFGLLEESGTYLSEDELRSFETTLLESDSNLQQFEEAIDDYRIAPSIAAEIVTKYDLEGWIGKGGMGQVIKAFDRNMNRPVAIKFIQHHLSNDQEIKDRFELEAKAPARLPSHSNLTYVYERGHTKEGDWVVTEFGGESLNQKLQREGPLSPHDATTIMKGLSKGLQVMHKKGLVHKDIKDGNIFIPEDGDKEDILQRAKLGDFGLVLFFDDPAIDENSPSKLAEQFQLGKDGSISGTLLYMAPEVINGLAEKKPKERNRILESSDIYALGVVFYKMLTGKFPFREKKRLDLLKKILDEKLSAKSPNEINPDIPTEVSDLVMRMIDKNYKKRPRTVVKKGKSSLVDDLSNLLEGLEE